MPTLLSYRFKLTRHTFTPLIVAPYVIKRNLHPKKGLLIDIYVPFPNPFLLYEYKQKEKLGVEWTLMNTSLKSIVREHKIWYRPLICRHWPKNINEEHMLVTLKYAVTDREVTFRGPRTNPPGNFKILEIGLFYVLDIYIQHLFFIMLVAFQHRIGLSYAKGSTYVWIPDLERIHGTMAYQYRQFIDTHIFMRNIRVYNKLPKIQYRHREDIWTQHRRLFWFRNVKPEL